VAGKLASLDEFVRFVATETERGTGDADPDHRWLLEQLFATVGLCRHRSLH
jgi:hypothetical protein